MHYLLYLCMRSPRCIPERLTALTYWTCRCSARFAWLLWLDSHDRAYLRMRL
jgi:hypothetical protein